MASNDAHPRSSEARPNASWELRRAVQALLQQTRPGLEVVAVETLGLDAGDGSTMKSMGYGRPIRIRTRDADGTPRSFVLHTATANAYGHDRRADRAADMLLAYDSFNTIPRHVAAVDVGAVLRDGSLLSLRDADELFVLTEYAPGHTYADELGEIARRGRATTRDVAHGKALATYLARLHTPVDAAPASYVRAVRDLLGSGEGIFGIVDGYPPNVPAAPPERLRRIEERCLAWRWTASRRVHRLRRTHGDFHPFNLLFDDRDTLSVLDASRGSRGDPADDLAALTLNYVFFGLQHPAAWAGGFGLLWDTVWSEYLSHRDDDELLAVIAPFFTWRALVLASPAWYPGISPAARDRLLGLVERALDAPRFELDWATELMK